MATGQQHVQFTGQTDRESLVLGSYEPDVARTGVPSGTTLTPVSGNQIITTPGTVLQDLDITGRVEIRAANVTIRRCRIRGDPTITSSYGLVHCTSGSASNVLVEDCTLACDSSTVSQWPDGILGHDYHARRCRIYDVEDGCGVFNVANPGDPSGVVVEGCYMGPLLRYATDAEQSDGSHDDVIQMQGGAGTILRYNKFWGYMSTTLADGALGGRQSPSQTQSVSCIMMNSTIGDPFDVEIYENWFYGGEVGLNLTDPALGVAGETTAIVHRNRFARHTTWFDDVPVLYLAAATWDFGAGTVDKNYWLGTSTEIPYQAG